MRTGQDRQDDLVQILEKRQDGKSSCSQKYFWPIDSQHVLRGMVHIRVNININIRHKHTLSTYNVNTYVLTLDVNTSVLT